MKLVIFGLTISSSWGNGHATLWRGLCRALARQGHHVVFFERDVPYYAMHRDCRHIDGGDLCLYPDWPAVRERARGALKDADAAIVTSYCPDALAAAALVLDSAVPVRAFYDLDAPVTLARMGAGEVPAYVGVRGYGDFDLVLSYAGGRALQGLQQQLGARRVAPLYGSVDPDLHRRTAATAHYRAALSYIGTYSADRQPALEALFIEPARRLPERKFLLAGAQYPPAFPWVPNIFFVQHLPPPEHAAFYSSSRLTLNVTRAAFAATGWAPSGRLFEAAACATPILSDAWEGLDAFFRPGEEILLAGSPQEACAAIELSDAELARIGDAARERVRSEHTAEHRAGTLVSLLQQARDTPRRGTQTPRAGVVSCRSEAHPG